MTTPSPLPFESLLSTRARYAVPLTTPRAPMQPLYEFGGGFPDPASFPYDGMVDATARMMKAEGAAAMTYGDPQGYLGLRELVCHKYELFESMKAAPENACGDDCRCGSELTGQGVELVARRDRSIWRLGKRPRLQETDQSTPVAVGRRFQIKLQDRKAAEKAPATVLRCSHVALQLLEGMDYKVLDVRQP